VSRKACAFKQRDIARAVRGATAAGMKVGRVDIEPTTGRISIISADMSAKCNDLDVELTDFEARHGEN
jgi:hypothetical protein